MISAGRQYLVSFVNFGRLRFKTEVEQELWSECSRLITHCVIYYNASLTSKLIERGEHKGDDPAVARFKQISPVAWQHLNFVGRYEFKRTPERIDLDRVVAALV